LEGELAQLGVVGDGVPLALRPYLELTARRYGRLPLGPLDPSGQESSRVSLGQIFVNLYAGVAVQPLAQPDDDKHEFYRAAVAHIFHNRQLILLGDPGSGKSTLLRFLAYCLAQHHLSAAAEWLEKLNWQVGRRKYDSEESELIYGRNADLKRLFKESQLSEQHWTGDAPLPVFIELRDFARTRFDPADPLALWQFVESRLALDGLEACAVPLKRLAENGRLLFLLDGVDEVPIGERPSIWQAISALEDGVYGGNCWLTTCRILSFAAAEAPKGIPTQTLRLLDEEQIEQFIESWYTALFEAGELNRAELETKMGNLGTAVQQPRLQPLAQNPMLLTIIAIVQTYYGTLPDQRAKLYQACVETLLLRWQRHKEAEAVGELPNVLEQLGTTQEDLERLLWEIGWQAHSGADGREDAAD
ncbi:MAG: hypothetical protein GY803_05605, partial [Chloroflexi bacterium]|nr:hypothetical protein [Chloroflexota bacterium]